MKKELIIHFGTYKTGSSSIQKMLRDSKNCELLAEKNINIVKDIHWNNGLDVNSAFCDEPEKFISNRRLSLVGKELEEKNERIRNSLIRECNKEGKLVIVGEAISQLTVSELKKMKKFLEDNTENELSYKISIYTRNPVTLSSSYYQELVRAQRTNEYRENISFHIKDIMESPFKALEVFGKNNVKVIAFEEACSHKYGVTGFFFEQQLGLGEELKNLNYIRDNESFCFEATKLGMYINNKYPFMDGKKIRKGRQRGDLIDLGLIKGNKFTLDKKRILEICENCKDELFRLKNETGIDYTDYVEKISNIEETEEYYDNDSVITSYKVCTKLVRETMIEYFSKININLAEALENIERSSK